MPAAEPSTSDGAAPARTRPAGQKPALDARAFAVEVARILADTRCHQVSVLDVRSTSPVTDYFVLATGSSPRQMKSAADAADEFGATVGYQALSRVGDDSSNWVVTDFFDVVVHIFSQESRLYYDLDGLWGDAERVEWERKDASTSTGSTGSAGAKA